MSLRVACVGAGFFSQFHIGSWKRLAQVELVGVCDLDQARAEQTGVQAFDDLGQMLASVQPDVLDVILPPTAQAAAIQQAIAAKIPTIICQKPFCASFAQAQEMTIAAKDAGLTLIVHENFRFQPWFRFIKARLDEGLIGRVLQATFRLRPGDGQGPDAYLDRQPYFRKMPRLLIHETGVHYIDVFRYLFGEATHVYADLHQENPVIAGEDAGFVHFQHETGVRAVFDGNRCLDHAADNTRRTMGEGLFEGTKGTLRLTGDGAVSFRNFGEITEQVLLEPDTHEGFGGDCTHALQEHVVAAMTSDLPIENIAEDYLKVTAVEQAIYLSAETHKKLVL